MNINLYPCFSHWKTFNNIWLYSDPHFADQEMKYLRKNYIGDDEQICRINSKVGKKDIIIILGDIGDINFIKKIKGYKVLIMGNHDKGASNYKRSIVTYYFSPNIVDGSIEDQKLKNLKQEGLRFEAFVINTSGQGADKYILDNHLFDEVYEGPLVISEKIILSHEPINLTYFLNIHGHDHSFKETYPGVHINMCAEHIDYTPVSLLDIINNGYLKNIDSIHRQTINKAISKKSNIKK